MAWRSEKIRGGDELQHQPDRATAELGAAFFDRLQRKQPSEFPGRRAFPELDAHRGSTVIFEVVWKE